MNDGYPVPPPYSRAGLLAKLTGAATLAVGALLYGNATSQLQTLALGTAGRVLVAGASAPAWSDSGLSYASSVLTVAGSVPGTPSAGQVAIGGGAIKVGGTLTMSAATGANFVVNSTSVSQSATGSNSIRTFGGIGADGAILSTSNILTNAEDTYLGADALSVPRLGFVKKTGAAPKLCYGNGISFAIATSNAANIAAASTFTDRFTISAAGDAVFTGPLTISGASLTLGNKVLLPGTLNSAGAFRSNSGASYWEFQSVTPATLGYAGFAGVSDFKVLDAAAADVFRASSTEVRAYQQLVVPNGTAGAPGLRLTSEATGLYRSSGTVLGFAVNGTASALLSSAGIFSATQLQALAASDSGVTIGQFINSSTGTAAFTRFFVGQDATTQNLELRHYGSGYTTAATYNIQASSAIVANAGATGGLTLVTRANAAFRVYTQDVLRLTIAGTGEATFTGAVTLPDGTAGAPGLRVTSEASGLYRFNATTLGVAVAGVAAATFASNGNLFVVGGVTYNGVGFQDFTDAATNAISDVQTFRHNGGTVATGFGSAAQWTLESTTTNNRNAARWTVEWADATDASRKARVIHYAYDTAARECMRMEGSGTAPLVGFLGATAVARQTIGAAATDPATTQTLANNIRTALSNLGLCQN